MIRDRIVRFRANYRGEALILIEETVLQMLDESSILRSFKPVQNTDANSLVRSETLLQINAHICKNELSIMGELTSTTVYCSNVHKVRKYIVK